MSCHYDSQIGLLRQSLLYYIYTVTLLTHYFLFLFVDALRHIDTPDITLLL